MRRSLKGRVGSSPTSSARFIGIVIKKREFLGEEFYAFCQQEYDKARVHLKNCGKPKDDYDIFLIKEAKFSSQFYRQFLD